MIWAIGIALYIACGVLAYGWGLAFLQHRFPSVRNGNDWMFPAGIALLGPCGLVGMILGNIGWGKVWQYGVQWRATSA